MSINRVMTAVALTGALAATAGCQSTKQALGMNKVVPDEFRVVTMAPLTVPPEYALRPPAPGEPRPQELQPESAARQALLGARQGAQRSEGERILASRAGADRADPLARYVVDDEFGDLAHKEEGWANRLLFWRREDPASQTATTTQSAEGAVVIDAASEYARVQALTGGRSGIYIAPRRDSGFKLPGL